MATVPIEFIKSIFAEVKTIAENHSYTIDIVDGVAKGSSMFTGTGFELSIDKNLRINILLKCYNVPFTSIIFSILRNKCRDDSTSVFIIDRRRHEESTRSTYLVNPENIGQFLYNVMIYNEIDWSLTYKNAQKIRSGSYGRALCDIIITCVEN